MSLPQIVPNLHAHLAPLPRGEQESRAETSPQASYSNERLTLRPVTEGDAGLITLFCSDKRIADGTRSILHPLPPGSAEAFIARAQAKGRDIDAWAIDSAQAAGALMGIVSLHRHGEGQSELRFWVAPGLWGSGIASGAIGLIVAANPHGSRSLFAEVFQGSPGPARVLTRNGFVYLGDAETYSLARKGKVPTWTYLRQMK